MNGYNLIRNWYAFKFENPSKCKAIHSDMYCYLVDLWNRLGQKKEFGLPTMITMEALGVGSYNTYKKTLKDLIDFGFIEIVQNSKNQHHSKIVALSNFDKALDKALDKASAKATDKATDKACDTINKQINKEQLNNKTIHSETPISFNFANSLIELIEDEKLAYEFLQVRKLKKAINSETAFIKLISEIKKTNIGAREVIKLCVENSWKGFNAKWIEPKINNDFKISKIEI